MTQKVSAPSPDASPAESTLQLSDLELPYLPLQTREFAQDPIRYFAAARETHPWLARSEAGYVVHQLKAIKDLLGRDDIMRTSFDGIVALMQAKGTPWGRFTEEQMLAHSGASHKRLRDLLAPRFTPRQADRHRPLMRKVVAELLDEWAPKGQCDFEEFASYFPVSVLCAMVGAPAGDIPHLRASLEALGLGFSLNRNHLPALQEAIGVLDHFVQKLVRERRASGRPDGESDLLDLLLEVSGDGQLTEREVYDMLIFLFVAGYDTSKNVLTYTMHLLLERPEIYQRCAADSEYCQQAIEEALRYFSPSTVFRMPMRDIVYEGVLIPKDTMLFFPLSIAGRDPAIEEANAYIPGRVVTGENRHVAFGRGMHICMGQFIARAQLEEGLHQITRRMRNPRRMGAPGWRPFPGVWGIQGLPISFDAETPAQRVDGATV